MTVPDSRSTAPFLYRTFQSKKVGHGSHEKGSPRVDGGKQPDLRTSGILPFAKPNTKHLHRVGSRSPIDPRFQQCHCGHLCYVSHFHLGQGSTPGLSHGAAPHTAGCGDMELLGMNSAGNVVKNAWDSRKRTLFVKSGRQKR